VALGIIGIVPYQLCSTAASPGTSAAKHRYDSGLSREMSTRQRAIVRLDARDAMSKTQTIVMSR
jgi:hypothetical protein